MIATSDGGSEKIVSEKEDREAPTCGISEKRDEGRTPKTPLAAIPMR